MGDLEKATALLAGRKHPRDPAYRKPVMIGSTAGLKPGEQFPEYIAWRKKRDAKEQQT